MSVGRVVTVVQARVSSTRLPGKVLLPLAGAPLLVRMVERVRRAGLAGTVAVATTTDSADDVIVRLCSREGIPVFRGHPTDLLDRHVAAARAFGGQHVVKVPSDCPLVDPGAIDRVLGVYLARPDAYDYVSNLHPATWPDGNDVEVMPLAALELARSEAARPADREHTTPFLWDQPERFRVGNVAWETGRDLSLSHRFTIDYPEDYVLIREVYDALYPADPSFGLDAILELLESRPDLHAVNERHRGVNWYRHHLGELKTITADMTRPEVA